MGDPFDERYEVPVEGGSLMVARAGPPAADADTVVLAVHGISASHMAWRTVARELSKRGDACLLAPDLRGRADSAELPGPYGMAAHIADLLAVLDYATGGGPVVLAGHSMGAYVVARLAAEHPDRAAAVVLIDGGLPVEAPSDRDPDEVLKEIVGPALTRLGVTFSSADDYVGQWRKHPAFVHAWDADVEAYVRHDLTSAPTPEEPGAVRCVTSPAAVREDGRELLLDEATRTALDRVHAPLWLLRAPRGMLDDDKAFIPRKLLDEFAAARPDAHVEEVADVNHYTIILGPGGGASRVTAAIDAAALRV